MKLAPVITWPLLVSPKKAKKQPAWPPTYLGSKTCLWPKCVRSWLGGLFGNQPMTKLARSLFACSEFVPSSPGVRSEFVRSLSGVCSEFVRSSFGVRSEFGVRSSLGVCSELVHEEPGASEKRLPRKTRSAPYYVVCGQNPNPKNVPMQDLSQITAFFVKTRNCRKHKLNLPKYEQNLGSNTTHFAAYRRGSFIVKLFPKNSSSPFLLAAKTHFCLDDPKPLSAGASSCLTPKA